MAQGPPSAGARVNVLGCQNESKFTNDWEQRITPSGQVHLICDLNAEKSDGR